MEKQPERRMARRFWLLGAAVMSIFSVSMYEHGGSTPSEANNVKAEAISQPVNYLIHASDALAPMESTTTTVPPLDPQAAHELMWEAQAAAANADGKYDRLAHCETQGNWRMKGSRFSGGVGFANSTWLAFRDREFMPANAGDATKAEQIVVAERVVHEVAPYGSWRGGKWGCAPTAGLP